MRVRLLTAVRRSPVMDISALVTFLAPVLPALLRGGQDAAAELAERVGAGAVGAVRALWDRLSPKVAGEPTVQEAAQQLAEAPDDERRRAVLEVRLGDLLAADHALADEVASLFATAERESRASLNVQGDGAIGVIGDVTGSVIASGSDVDVTR